MKRCPDEIAHTLHEILRVALLRIRNSADGLASSREADHVHNIPTLLEHYSPDFLRFYLETEVPIYVRNCRESGRNITPYEPLWMKLEQAWQSEQ